MLLAIGAIALFSILLATTAEASLTPLGKVIELEALTLQWKNHLSGGRDALLYPHEPGQTIEFDMDMDVLHFFYCDTRVFGIQDETQYRGFGLNTHIGARLTDWLRFEWEHVSKHRGDEAYPVMWRFPVDNSWNLIIDIYRAHSSFREALF